MIVREVDGQPSTQVGRPFVISVYGADRPGIVHGFAQLLAERAVNITNLLSHSADGLYTIILEVALSPSIDEEELQSALSRLGHRWTSLPTSGRLTPPNSDGRQARSRIPGSPP